MDIVYAKAPVRVIDSGGAAIHHPPGSHWPANDPYVRANPGEFSADPRYYLSFSEVKDWYLDPDATEPTAEEATAVPGERRNARRS